MAQEQSGESRVTAGSEKSASKDYQVWPVLKFVGYCVLMFCVLAISRGVSKDLTRAALNM